jgi:hypothetical protein
MENGAFADLVSPDCRSLLNLLQQYDYWETYFNHVGTDKTKANLLGLLTNMFTIGSIISMFIV